MKISKSIARFTSAGAAALLLLQTFVFIPAAYAIGSPTITEYTTTAANSQPLGIATGADGNLWITENNTNKIAKVTTAGVVTEYTIPSANSFPWGIARGPDGNMWFAESANDKIGKITPTGTITEYTTPTSGSTPEGITAGPDGNMWFTENTDKTFGKITTSGTITEYANLSSGAFPEGITAGADGNLWIAETNNNKIAKVTTSGVVTEYTVTTATSHPEGLTAGPDGNVWFTENFGSKIGKITPTGTITEYATTTASSSPWGITAGVDGNLWFVENSGNKIAKITTAGVVTEYSIPTSASSPVGIAAGADGNLWFTEGADNQFGKLVPPTVRTLTQPSSTAQVFLKTPEGTNITCSNTVTEASLTTQDAAYSYPTGLLNFCFDVVSGSSNQVAITVQTDLTPAQVTARNYNPTTKVYVTVPGATITDSTLNGHHALKLVYNITDGGPLDADGVANGAILDPVGLATTDSTVGAPNTGFGIYRSNIGKTALISGIFTLSLVGAGLTLRRYSKNAINQKS